MSLPDIAQQIANLLNPGISIANGFSFNFGDVNQPDLALVKNWPIADITYLEDMPENDKMAAYGYDVTTFVIKVIPTNPISTAVNNPMGGMATPVHAIDPFIDEVINAVKSQVRFQQGRLPLSGNAYMVYKGYKKIIEKSGDIFHPDSINFTLDVHYQSTEVMQAVTQGAGPLDIQISGIDKITASPTPPPSPNENDAWIQT